MMRNNEGNYTYRDWTIVPEHQDVNGRRFRKGLWLCFAPGTERVTFHASTLQIAVSKIDAATEAQAKSLPCRKKQLDSMSVDELEREYDRLLPIMDKGNNEERLEYVRDLLVAKRSDHQFRGWR